MRQYMLEQGATRILKDLNSLVIETISPITYRNPLTGLYFHFSILSELVTVNYKLF